MRGRGWGGLCFHCPVGPEHLGASRNPKAAGVAGRHPAPSPHLFQSLLQTAPGWVLEVYLSLPHLAPLEPRDHMPNHMTVSLVDRERPPGHARLPHGVGRGSRLHWSGGEETRTLFGSEW